MASQMKQIASLETCCTPVLEGTLAAGEAEHLASAFSVLADPARLRLVSFIAAQPDGEACVCDLTSPVGLSQPTVSHHLKVLHEAGIVERERRGRWVFYRVLPERLSVLADALIRPVAATR